MAHTTVSASRLFLKLAWLPLALLWPGALLAVAAGGYWVLSPMLVYPHTVGGIYLADTEGRRVQLIDRDGMTLQPAWSPDGGRMAFVSSRDEGLEIYLMEWQNWGITRLTVTDANNTSPQWFPDGETLAYRFERSVGLGSYDIFMLHVPSGEVRNLTDDNPDNSQPMIAASGEQVAYIYNNRRLRVASVPYGEVTLDVAGINSTPAWSPLEDVLAYVGPRGQFTASVIDTIYLARPGSEDVIAAYPLDDLVGLRHLAWAPDGTQLAFVAESARGRAAPVHLLDVETGDVRTLPITGRHSVHDLAWSPDGDYLMLFIHTVAREARLCFYHVEREQARCPHALNQVFRMGVWRP